MSSDADHSFPHPEPAVLSATFLSAPSIPSFSSDPFLPSPIPATSSIATSPTSTTTATSPTPTCTPVTDCAPATCLRPCKPDHFCRLSVVNTSCECPVATCVKLGFDTGSGSANSTTVGPNGSTNRGNNGGSTGNLLGPLIGGIAGLILVIVGLLLLLRRMRHRQQQEKALLDDDTFLGQSDNAHSHHGTHQDWHGSPCMEARSTVDTDKDNIIQIGYIPSILSDGSHPIQLPAVTAQLQQHHLERRPHAPFMDQDQSKHSSVASDSSSLSTGVLKEAVVMAITRTNASPQVIRLENMKNHASMIQRSNSLHSSNSIKRTLSQLTRNKAVGRNKNGHMDDGEETLPSPSMAASRMGSSGPTAVSSEEMSRRLELTIDHDDFVQDLTTLGSFLDGQDKEMNTGHHINNNPYRDSNNSNCYSDSDTGRETVYMYTPAVIVTGPSVRSSAQSTEASMSPTIRRRSGPSVPSMVLESRPFQSMSSSSGSTPIGYYYQHPSSHAPANTIPKPGCTPDHGYPLTATTKSVSVPSTLPSSSSSYSNSGIDTTVGNHPAPTTALVSLLASTSNIHNNNNNTMSSATSNYSNGNSSSTNLPPKISTTTTPAMFTFSSSTVHPLSSSSSTSFYSFKSLPGPSPVSAGASPVTPLGYGFPTSSTVSGTTIHGGGGSGGGGGVTNNNSNHFNNDGSMGNMTTRDSTLSTLSSIDAPSTTTRGDGEEIMIFWDGHRGSRGSSTMQ